MTINLVFRQQLGYARKRRKDGDDEMTIKEAIGKFTADQLTYRYHRLASVNTKNDTIQRYRDLAKLFYQGDFQIIITGLTADGSEVHNWMVRPNLSKEDTLTANKIVVKTEVAMGWNIYHEPFPILKLTADDETIYYFDGEDKLTTRKWELRNVDINAQFDEITL